MPGVELPFDEQAVERSSHFAFAVLLKDRATRDRFRDDLKEAGIQTTWYPALHKFTEYRRFAPADGLPATTEAADRHCALPLSSMMDEAAVEHRRGRRQGRRQSAGMSRSRTDSNSSCACS